MPEVTTTPSVPKFLLYPSFQKTAARILGGLNSKKICYPKVSAEELTLRAMKSISADAHAATECMRTE